ncbi:MAG: mechanosensitive ion channel family protein [Rhodothermales bacterium]
MDDLSLGFLSQEILWGVPVWKLGAALGIIFLGFLSRRIIRRIFSGFIKQRAKNTKILWDDDVIELLPTPLALLVQIALWHLAVAFFELPAEPIDIRTYVFNGLNAAIVGGLVWVSFALIEVFARGLTRQADGTESKLDDLLVPMLRKTIKFFIAIIAVVWVIQNLGYSVTSLIASLGIGGLALALAAQDTVSNFFGSIVVFTDRPFQVGDWVELGGIEGVIEEVGFRTTRIRQFDKVLVVLPNSMFTSTPIRNFSQRSIRRIKMTVGLTYETSSAQMQTFLEGSRQLLNDHPMIDQNFHFAHFVEFGDSSLNVQFYCFTNTAVWVEWLQGRESLMLQVMDLVESLGLEMAFPTRTVYLRDEQWAQKQGASIDVQHLG